MLCLYRLPRSVRWARRFSQNKGGEKEIDLLNRLASYAHSSPVLRKRMMQVISLKLHSPAECTYEMRRLFLNFHMMSKTDDGGTEFTDEADSGLWLVCLLRDSVLVPLNQVKQQMDDILARSDSFRVLVANVIIVLRVLLQRCCTDLSKHEMEHCVKLANVIATPLNNIGAVQRLRLGIKYTYLMSFEPEKYGSKLPRDQTLLREFLMTTLTAFCALNPVHENQVAGNERSSVWRHDTKRLSDTMRRGAVQIDTKHLRDKLLATCEKNTFSSLYTSALLAFALSYCMHAETDSSTVSRYLKSAPKLLIDERPNVAASFSLADWAQLMRIATLSNVHMRTCAMTLLQDAPRAREEKADIERLVDQSTELIADTFCRDHKKQRDKTYEHASSFDREEYLDSLSREENVALLQRIHAEVAALRRQADVFVERMEKVLPLTTAERSAITHLDRMLRADAL